MNIPQGVSAGSIALIMMDEALTLLQERGIVDEDSGIDLLELAEAVAAEIEFREVAAPS